MMDDAREIGYALLIRRKRRGLSQAQLARLAGISRNYVSLIERGGAANISMRIFMQLAKILWDNPNEFMDLLWRVKGGNDE